MGKSEVVLTTKDTSITRNSSFLGAFVPLVPWCLGGTIDFKLPYFALLVLCSMITLWAQSSESPSDKEKPPVQPIPFNHKVHVGLGLQCLGCHAIKEPGFAAGYPQEATCMACHVGVKTDSPAILKLAEHHKTKKPLPWVKIYQVPEYVWFSHQSHHKDAGFTCETCHGPVEEREVLVKEKPTSMASCMACHAKHGASNACNFCHNPG